MKNKPKLCICKYCHQSFKSKKPPIIKCKTACQRCFHRLNGGKRMGRPCSYSWLDKLALVKE